MKLLSFRFKCFNEYEIQIFKIKTRHKFFENSKLLPLVKFIASIPQILLIKYYEGRIKHKKAELQPKVVPQPETCN